MCDCGFESDPEGNEWILAGGSAPRAFSSLVRPMSPMLPRIPFYALRMWLDDIALSGVAGIASRSPTNVKNEIDSL